MAIREELLAVSPLDGRYAEATAPLTDIASEFGLISRRVTVETKWLAKLASGDLPDVAPLGDVALDHLGEISTNFSVDDAVEVKTIEQTTRHDVKAVEIWLRSKLSESAVFSDYLELIHFATTSDDVNSLAYGMILGDAKEQVVVPGLEGIAESLEERAESYASIPMLSRTHGQPATPTTLGKEMRVFSERVRRATERIGHVAMYGKFNGTTGNFNAMQFAYPEVNWPAFTADFIRSLGMQVNGTTTQIEPHDWVASFANEVALSNTVLIDFAKDMWTYISHKFFTQEVDPDATGSSIMPHKVNPIDFENAEGNLGAANATLAFLASKLPISRMQRDLSDSSALRNLGVSFGHTLVAYRSLNRGLGKAYANPEAIAADLQDEWSVLTEPVQTVMRRYRVAGAYDAIKAVSRGKSLTRDDYINLVASIDGIPDFEKLRLITLTPQTYTGLAGQIALGEYLEL